MKGIRFVVSSASIGLTLVVLLTTPALADDAQEAQLAPESADELITSFERGLEGRTVKEARLSEFFESSKLFLKLRNYYLSRTRFGNSDPLAWAQGGSIEYNVDKVAGHFGLTAEYFTSFKLYAPDERDGTLLLESGQNNIDTLGVLNPRLNFEGNTISAYRQRFELPYVNVQENRMVPNTFEGYVIGMPKVENENFQYIAGYITEIKKRNEESFQSMSEAAGVAGKERGMIVTGARYFFLPELSLAAINYFVDDVLNIVYSEAVHKAKLNDRWANAFSVQYSDQRSVGQDLLRSRSYSTFFWGIQNAVSYKNATLKTAFTFNDTGGDLRSPYGSYPGYNCSITEDFNRAGEKAWQVGLAYNFERLGLKELGVSTAFVNGFDSIDENTKEDLDQKDETDVTVDYKVEDGLLQGLWVRLRGAWIDQSGGKLTEDYRIIVNYQIPLKG